jgi:hypothetical protein
MPSLVIREAAAEDGPELLRMMRLLAEQEPGKIQFEEALLVKPFISFCRFRHLGEFGFSTKAPQSLDTLC